MIFALACSLVTLLVAAGTAIPYTKDKITYYPKPRSSMLKPLSASDKYQAKPLSRSTFSVDQNTAWLVTWYYSYNPGTMCSTDVILKKGLPSGQCLTYEDSTYGAYDCSNYYSTGYCYYSAYYDADCTYPKDGSPSQVYLNMCEVGDASSNGYVADNGVDFLSQMSTIEYGFPVPLTGDSTTFTTYSNSSSCDPSTMTSYTLAYANTCYTQYDEGYYGYTSSKYVSPYLYKYSTNGCSSNNGYYLYNYPPGECEAVSSSYAYSSAMMVLNQPPSSPSTTPTSPPTTPSPPTAPAANTAMVVGAAVGGFAALALLDTMLYLFAPSAGSQTDDAVAQAPQTGEF